LSKSLTLIYGVAAYLMFLASFLYAIGFVGDAMIPEKLAVPKTVNTNPADVSGRAILINVLLLSVFAIQHSVMARPAFKKWWTQCVPPSIERSTYVALTSLILGLIYWQWHAMTPVIWNVEQPVLKAILTGLFFAGWGIVLLSSFLIDHFELFGLRQTYFFFRGREFTSTPFVERLLYRYVRHPLMLGFIIAFWATPRMTAGHLLFSSVVTVYIFVGIFLEERDLLIALGDDYREYRRRTSMVIPLPPKPPHPK